MTKDQIIEEQRIVIENQQKLIDQQQELIKQILLSQPPVPVTVPYPVPCPTWPVLPNPIWVKTSGTTGGTDGLKYNDA